MVTRRWREIVRVAVALAIAAPGVWQLSLQVRLWLGRFRYPWDIEWIESAVLYQAFRSLHHQSTYGPPKQGYLPLFHPPAYPSFLGLVGRIVRIDYASARTISMLFFLGAAALVVRECVKHDRDRVAGWVTGILAVGCAAAGAQLCDSFYDLIREDMMGFFLVVLAAALAQAERPGPRWIALVAAILTTALYTRFPYVFFLVWILIFVFVRKRRLGLWLGMSMAALSGLVLVALQYTSRGWFWMYTVSILQDQAVDPQRFIGGLKSFVAFAPFVVVLPAVALVLGWRKALSRRSTLWLGLLACAVPASLLPWAKVGGFENDFLPLAFLPGVVALLLATDVARALGRHPRVALAVRLLVGVGFGAFLIVRTYDITRYQPTAEARRRADRLNERITALDGGAIAPRHAFIPIHDGHVKTHQFSDMPYLDMAWVNYPGLKLGSYIDQVHARWALVSGTEVAYTAGELAWRYQLEGNLPPAPGMILGERSTLRYLLKWRDDETSARVLFDFEQPNFDGWTITGDAFGQAPTSARPRGQGAIQGVVGLQLANSYHPQEGDRAMGSLISPPFIIDRPHIGLRVGGGWRTGTRVELLVWGKLEKSAVGIFEYSETLTHVVWDVSAFEGQQAQIALVDEDKGSWGHLLCDQIVMY